MRHIHRNNALTTTSIDHHHIGKALINFGKMKICKTSDIWSNPDKKVR